MTVQELLEKVAEEGIGLYEMKSYNLVISDTKGKPLTINDFKLDQDKKQIQIKLK